jgi:hypothetical protein
MDIGSTLRPVITNRQPGGDTGKARTTDTISAMRICLVARNRFHGSRKARATHQALTAAGHDVVVVAVDRRPPEGHVTTTVSNRSTHPVVKLTDRLRLTDSRKSLPRRIAAAAAATEADIYLPLDEEVLPVAVRAARMSGGIVQRTPKMPSAEEVDLIHLAPAHPELALPTHGMGSEFTPAYHPEPYEPQAGRYRGGKVVICYRRTPTNPGRYIEAALGRSGLEVQVETEIVDLDSIDEDTRFVLFVESPYPALEVSGNTAVPILFWVHHGEHHLHANLRLADRYRADAVLLAHSWHLAHWFPAPVHRFPFAIAPEVMGEAPRLADRRFDVAMVGSNLRGEAWQYQRRRHLVETLETHLPSDRTAFVEGISPEELIALYANSRIVIDEGGIRHYPITMRVFEAIESGAALLTDHAPGLDMVFDEDQFATLTDDVIADVKGLLGDLEGTQTMADRAYDHARNAHTYDHRVDLLMDIAARTTKRDIRPPKAMSDLARLIDGDVEVQRLVHDEIGGLPEELLDREVWAASEREGRLTPVSMDAAVITAGEASSKQELLDSARRYLYVHEDVSGIDEYVKTRRPEAVSERRGRFKRIDLMSDSYRAKSAGSSR